MNWDLSALFNNETNLEKSITKSLKDAKVFENSYKNRVKTLKTKEFLKALNEYEEVLEATSKAMTYAFLIFATDSTKGAFLAKYQKLATQIEESILFFELEFNKIDNKKQDKIIKKAGVKSFYLQSLKKHKRHQLSLLEEKIILKKDLVSTSAFSRLFDEHLSRLKFNLNRKKVSEEVVLSELYNPDREKRKKASISLSNGLKPHLNLLAYIFNMIKTDLKIDCDLRAYSSLETPRHISNKITQKSVDKLIETTTKNFHIVSDYYKIKAKLLGLDKLYDYDRYAPLETSEVDEYDFEKSKEIVLSAFKNFDERFYEIAIKAFDEKWIDVYPKDNKRGGAFSHGATTDVHPYVLLNHTNRRRDLFTLAHELGHAIHQYLSRDVGYLSGDTPLTTAETASIFAEMIIFDYIKNTLKDKELIALYASKLEDIFATLFRQIIFTTFERKVHNFEGELSVDDFSKFWYEENAKMFGDSVILTKNYESWWSYIPHFIHSPFYCYAYSYGQLLVLALYGLYKQNTLNDFKDKYIEFLSSGGSKSPKELILLFGFDIEDNKFWEIGIEEVEAILNEFKNITKEK